MAVALIAPAFVCDSSLHMLETNPFLRVRLLKQSAYAGSKQITLTCNQRQRTRLNIARKSPIITCRGIFHSPNFLARDYNDSLQEKNEDKIDGKDKWVKRWEHFQFPIGVPDNDLGQVGLWREVLSFPVPNYLTSYPFSFIRACVCMNCLSSLLLSV